MTRLGYMAAGLLSTYLSFAQCTPAVLADVPSKIETKVAQPYPGLESRVEPSTLNNGLYNGRYRAEGEVVIQNNGNVISGPLDLMYSLCFLERDGKTGCRDGKREVLEGLPQGELRRHFSFKERYAPRDNTPRKGWPKISVSLMKGPGFIYEVHHFIPVAATYQCKDNCPKD